MKARAKVNLALVVGPLRPDGKHEVLTVYQRLELADELELEPVQGETRVDGFAGDTLIRRALELAAPETRWRVRIEKRIPVAAGLGGGSSDAAAALLLANEAVGRALSEAELGRLAATIGADVPFFLREGPQLGSGDGSELEPLELPQDYTVLLFLPRGETKTSTAAVYRAFDERNGAAGWEERRARLLDALARGDLAAFPSNDLATSAYADDLRRRGAFRADVSGAGPAVYGLFAEHAAAEAAAAALAGLGHTWITTPAW